MPIKQAGKKALRQMKKRRVANLVVIKKYKDAVKAVERAISKGEKDLAEKIRLAQKALDKAVKNKVLKSNAASRKLSRLMKKVRLSAVLKK